MSEKQYMYISVPWWRKITNDVLKIILSDQSVLGTIEIAKYSQNSMAQTSLGPWKFVWGLIMVPGQEANGDNSSIQ